MEVGIQIKSGRKPQQDKHIDQVHQTDGPVEHFLAEKE